MVQLHHTAHHRGAVEKRYACTRCGHEDRATVLVKGSGRAREPALIDLGTAGGGRDAANRARYAAAAAGAQTLRLARCPRCKRRDTGAHLGFWVGAALKMTLLGGLVFLATWLALGDDLALGVHLGIASACAAAFYALDVHWRWASADRRVIFESGARRRSDGGR